VPGLQYTWDELQHLPPPLKQRERETYAKLYACDLDKHVIDGEESFDEVLRCLRKRRRKERSEALQKGTQFAALRRGVPMNVYLIWDRVSTFYRCWVKAGDREVIYDAEINYGGVSEEDLIYAVSCDCGLI
jgi:hypothetical protein